MRGNIIVISAPSGAGKTTLSQMLLKEDKSVVRSVSFTTRPVRSGEKDGKDYHFITQETFEGIKKKKGFLESEMVYGCYYGTPRRFVESELRKGRDVLLTIDVKGALQVRGKYPESILIFLVPPSIKDLRERLIKRASDSHYEIKKRLEVARWELSQIKRYDYLIVNDNIKRALCQLKAILIAARCRIQ
ncbi:MAG: guanylate kinase [Candidatus Omnitrophica bacterium]|nr:guanylate kinase [Candidatus Omnitrophota bacterium]